MRREDSGFVFGIQAVGGLIEDQQPGTAQQRARQRQPLALALRQGRAAVADDRVEAVRAGARRTRRRPQSCSASRKSLSDASGRAHSRLARTVSWNRKVSCAT